MIDVSREMQIPAEHIQNVFGQYDSNVKKLERQFKVSIVDRDGSIRISGREDAVKRVCAILK